MVLLMMMTVVMFFIVVVVVDYDRGGIGVGRGLLLLSSMVTHVVD